MALYDNEAEEEDDLAFNKGDLIEVTNFEGGTWWTGSLNGKTGVFPSNYVQLRTNMPSAPVRATPKAVSIIVSDLKSDGSSASKSDASKSERKDKKSEKKSKKKESKESKESSKKKKKKKKESKEEKGNRRTLLRRKSNAPEVAISSPSSVEHRGHVGAETTPEQLKTILEGDTSAITRKNKEKHGSKLSSVIEADKKRRDRKSTDLHESGSGTLSSSSIGIAEPTPVSGTKKGSSFLRAVLESSPATRKHRKSADLNSTIADLNVESKKEKKQKKDKKKKKERRRSRAASGDETTLKEASRDASNDASRESSKDSKKSKSSKSGRSKTAEKEIIESRSKSCKKRTESSRNILLDEARAPASAAAEIPRKGTVGSPSTSPYLQSHSSRFLSVSPHSPMQSPSHSSPHSPSVGSNVSQKNLLQQKSNLLQRQISSIRAVSAEDKEMLEKLKKKAEHMRRREDRERKMVEDDLVREEANAIIVQAETGAISPRSGLVRAASDRLKSLESSKEPAGKRRSSTRGKKDKANEKNEDYLSDNASDSDESDSDESSDSSVDVDVDIEKLYKGPFKDAGKAVGIQMWRMERMAPVLLADSDYGKLYDGECYLLLLTKSVAESDQGRFRIFYWLGSKAAIDKTAAVAIRAVELNDRLKRAAQVSKEEQGEESKEFRSLFGSGLRILQGGEASAIKSAARHAPKPRLLQIRGNGAKVFVEAAELGFASLQQENAYVLVSQAKAWIWCGMHAPFRQKIKAMDVAQSVRAERMGRLEIIELDASNAAGRGASADEQEFWSYFKERGSGIQLYQDMNDHRLLSLYKLSSAAGKLSMEVLAQSMDYLSKPMLDSRFVFIVDAEVEIFVWNGKSSHRSLRGVAMVAAERLLHDADRPPWAIVTRVVEFAEPALFRDLFYDWHAVPLHVLEEQRRQALEAGNAEVEQLSALAIVQKITRCQVRVRKDLEEQELPFDPDDEEVGVQFYKIDENKAKRLPEEKRGFFKDHSSYIVVAMKRDEKTETVAMVVYYWEGLHNDNRERDFLFFKLSFMKDLLKKREKLGLTREPVIFRVSQGREPTHFLVLLNGDLVVLHSSSSDRDLYHVSGTEVDDTRCTQIEARARNLNSGDTFILQTPNKIWLWFGRGSNQAERDVALGFPELLNSDAATEEVLEHEEPEEFWEAIGGREGYATSAYLADDPDDAVLYAIVAPTGVPDIEGVNPFNQQDLISDGVFIVDAHDTVWLWIGPTAHENIKSMGSKAARLYAEQSHMPCIQVNPGDEPLLFTCHFIGWQNSEERRVKKKQWVDPRLQYKAKQDLRVNRTESEYQQAQQNLGEPTEQPSEAVLPLKALGDSSQLTRAATQKLTKQPSLTITAAPSQKLTKAPSQKIDAQLATPAPAPAPALDRASKAARAEILAVRQVFQKRVQDKWMDKAKSDLEGAEKLFAQKVTELESAERARKEQHNEETKKLREDARSELAKARELFKSRAQHTIDFSAISALVEQHTAEAVETPSAAPITEAITILEEDLDLAVLMEFSKHLEKLQQEHNELVLGRASLAVTAVEANIARLKYRLIKDYVPDPSATQIDGSEHRLNVEGSHGTFRVALKDFYGEAFVKSCNLVKGSIDGVGELIVLEDSPGFFTASYAPLAQGNYSMRISVAGKQIPGSPFQLHVKAFVPLSRAPRNDEKDRASQSVAAADPSKSRIEVETLQAITSRSGVVVLTLCDEYGKKLRKSGGVERVEARLIRTGGSGKGELMPVIDYKNGQYGLVYGAYPEPASFEIAISLKVPGVPYLVSLPESPFDLLVRPSENYVSRSDLDRTRQTMSLLSREADFFKAEKFVHLSAVQLEIDDEPRLYEQLLESPEASESWGSESPLISNTSSCSEDGFQSPDASVQHSDDLDASPEASRSRSASPERASESDGDIQDTAARLLSEASARANRERERAMKDKQRSAREQQEAAMKVVEERQRRRLERQATISRGMSLSAVRRPQ